MDLTARHGRRASSHFTKYLILFNLFLSVLAVDLYAQRNGVGADGLTFEQRKQQWMNSLPSPSSGMDFDERLKYLFSWLEAGVYNDAVSEAIRQFVGEYWYQHIRSQHGYAAMILLKYGDRGTNLISDADEQVIKDKYMNWIEHSDLFTNRNPNKQVYAMVGVYLFTHYYDDSLVFPIYGYSESTTNVDDSYRNSWPEFSYNGRTYRFGGGPYDAHQLARDYLLYVMDGWYVAKSSPKGQREFDSLEYTYAFPGAMALLTQLAPGSDQTIKTRSKMATDVILLDSVLDYSANSWGGTLGRMDYWLMGRAPIFPFHHWWGMGDKLDGGTAKWNITINYHVGYVPPDVIVDVGVLDDEPDNYWHFHKEYNEWLLHNPGYGKWNFVTKHYNLGSNVGPFKRGWQLNVKGPGRTGFIRLWINEDSAEPASNYEGSYLGSYGHQYRNALFADIGATPHLWEKRNGAQWDIQESDGGWLFKKLGKSMVAIRMAATTAAVEVAIEGVDYPSWTEFKNAVKNNAVLTDSYFITSRQDRIDNNDRCGLNQPGDCSFPFERMETVDHRGNMIVSWNNNVMTVSRHGETATYNFNNWTFQEAPATPDFNPPEPPNGVVAEPLGN